MKCAWEEHGKVRLLPHKHPTDGDCSGLRAPRLLLLKTHLRGRGEFPYLLAFCLEESVPGSLSVAYQLVLAVLMLSRVCNHAHGARGAWTLQGQPLAPFVSLSSGPTLSLAMWETPARPCLFGLLGMKYGVFPYVRTLGLGFKNRNLLTSLTFEVILWKSRMLFVWGVWEEKDHDCACL